MIKIIVTPNARTKMVSILADNDCLRIGLKDSGCTGFKYTMEIDSMSLLGDDHIIDLADGKTLLVDPISAQRLNNTTIDYIESRLTSEFVYHNPNVTDICGCTKSVSFD